MALRSREVYELAADDSKLLEAYHKMDGAQKRALSQAVKTISTTKEQGGAVNYLTGQWKELIGTALGMVGVNSLIQKGIGLIKEYDQHLKKVDEKQVKSAGGAISLAMLQRPEDVQWVLREAAVIAAQEGISPEAAFDFFEQAQAIHGTFEAGKAAAIPAIRLAKVTQDTETAQKLIKIADQLGMSQEDFNALIVGMAEPAGANVAQIAEAAPEWALFTGRGGEPEKYLGGAVTSVLSRGIKDEELSTYVKALHRVISDVGETDEAKLAKKAKSGELTIQERITQSMAAEGRTYVDLNNFERLMGIYQQIKQEYGEITADTIRQAGIVEQREVKALATLMKPGNWELFAETLSEAPEYAQRYDLDEKIAAIQMEPAIRQKFLEDQAAATAEAWAFMGPESEAARERAAQIRAVGAETGYGMGVDEETGAAGYGRQVVSGEGFQPSRGAYVGPYGVYINKEELEPGRGLQQERLQAALDENVRTLKEIAENTRKLQETERVVMRSEGW